MNGKCKTCELYPEDNFKSYRNSAEENLASIQRMLERIGKTPKGNTAITLETITADFNDLQQNLVESVARIRGSVQHCSRDREKK